MMKCFFVFKQICALFIIVVLLMITVQTGKPDVLTEQVLLHNYNYLSGISAESDEVHERADVFKESANETYTCNCSKELIDIVREQMLERNTNFTVNYTGDTPESVLNTTNFRTFLDSVFAFDDPEISSDYDYLKISWISSNLIIAKAGEITQYGFVFKYLTTKSEENTINTRVAEIQKTLNVSDADNYNKIAAVNSYIIKNVSYDIKMNNKSAYTALINGSTICRGYVLLAYQMLDKLDVPVRIITGIGNGQPHTWLIVNIDDYWYNLDITWNDQTHSDSFFLKCDKDFYMHKEDNYFKSDSFIKDYPKAQKSFEK